MVYGMTDPRSVWPLQQASHVRFTPFSRQYSYRLWSQYKDVLGAGITSKVDYFLSEARTKTVCCVTLRRSPRHDVTCSFHVPRCQLEWPKQETTRIKSRTLSLLSDCMVANARRVLPALIQFLLPSCVTHYSNLIRSVAECATFSLFDATLLRGTWIN